MEIWKLLFANQFFENPASIAVFLFLVDILTQPESPRLTFS